MGMSIDECIAYLENVSAEKKPRSRKARRIIEHLKELKRYKEVAAGYGACTERDSFYYGKGYNAGRKELVNELMSKLSEEVDADIDDEWYAGRDCGIGMAMNIIESMSGEVKPNDGKG